jgi:RNA polymerase sigma-70 factor (ECF subfamily)
MQMSVPGANPAQGQANSVLVSQWSAACGPRIGPNKQGLIMAMFQRPPARPSWDEEILKHLPALHRYALGMARNHHAAEDHVQETVVKAYSCIDKFQPGSNLRAWLFTILRNTFYSGIRKQRREVADSDGLYAARLVTPREHNGKLAMGEFLNAFDQFSSERRDLITLVAVAGHSYGVASRMIGIPIGTDKSRLSRARAQLTETLDGTAPPVPHGACPMPVTPKAPQDGKWPFH